MHVTHAQTVCTLDRRSPDLADMVRSYFRLQPHLSLFYSLRTARLGQADLVLCLLRTPHPHARAYVEQLVGRPIAVLPCVRLLYPVNGKPRVQTPRITWVAKCNPRKPKSAAAARFAEVFKPGRTLEQARARGATTRDVRWAVRRGWIKMEELT